MASLESARSIIKSLLASGYEAYLVGGCVRDTLLGRTPKDYDIATSATPDIVKTIFGHVIPTGEKHGTVTVVSDDNYEVTTFRVESGYTDMRHPDKVEFVRNLTDDLARRDFTINAMAMDADGDIIDPFGGQEDLKKKLIRTVGLASDRFHEDPLRELRAVRFAAQLGFGIHKDTFLYLKATTMIENISKERIRDEIVKMLMSPGATYGIQILRNTAMWDFIFPRFAAKFVNRFVMNPYHYLDIYMHSLQVLNYVSVKYSDPDIVLKIAAFLHDYGKPSSYEQDENGIDRFHGHAAQSVEEVREWMVDLRFDNTTIDQVLKLIEYHDMFVEDYTGSAMKSSLTKLIRAFNKDFTLVEKWVALRMADISAQNVFYINERVQKLAIVSKIIMDLRKEDACIKVSDLKISGNDLKAIGYVEGPQIGNILKKMLDLVASDQLQNTKEILIEYAQKEKGDG